MASRIASYTWTTSSGVVERTTSFNLLRRALASMSSSSWSTAPPAAARGEKRRATPRLTFPPPCHTRESSTALSARRPTSTSPQPILPPTASNPLMARLRIAGPRATPPARKCSYLVSGKSRVLWTFPGFGYDETSSRAARLAQRPTRSPASHRLKPDLQPYLPESAYKTPTN
jgi:hypothetical protein